MAFLASGLPSFNFMPRPIGIFDSGIGGLTVVREVRRLLPDEPIIYIGDTARVPWGTRGADTITQFTQELIDFLKEKRAKVIMAACHTASAVALPKLKRREEVIGVIEPTVEAALTLSRGRIGVIGTPATIASRAWERALRGSGLSVFPQACPLLVPLVEEGFLDHEITRILLREYLGKLKEVRVDTLILACTHYPLLQEAIQKEMGKEVSLINPGVEAASFLAHHLVRRKLTSRKASKKFFLFFTDPRAKSVARAEMFLGEKLGGRIRGVKLNESI